MQKSLLFFKEFNAKLTNSINKISESEYKLFINTLKASKKKNIFIFGNGGSSAIASHVSVDLANLGFKTLNFNEYNLITCYSNDFGYANWISKSLENHAKSQDLIILISSSGKSKNIINAAKFAKVKKMNIVTLSGFLRSNQLSKLGHINFWIDSKSYNIVETAHQIILVSAIDFLKK